MILRHMKTRKPPHNFAEKKRQLNKRRDEYVLTLNEYFTRVHDGVYSKDNEGFWFWRGFFPPLQGKTQ